MKHYSKLGEVTQDNLPVQTKSEILNHNTDVIDWVVDLPLVESQPVKKLVGDITFNRASKVSNINGSGISEELGVDEPAFTKDGLGVYNTYTNLCTYSEDLTQWTAVNSAVLSQDGTLAPNGQQAWIVDNTANASGNVQRICTLSDLGQQITMQYLAKAGSTDICRLRWISYINGTTQDYNAIFNLTTGEFELIDSALEGVTAEYIGDGWYLFSVTATRNNTGNNGLRIDLAADNLNQGTIYYSEPMVVESPIPLPYVKTEATPVTVAETDARVPVVGNLPSEGSSFTIMCDLPPANIQDLNGTPWRINTTATISRLYLSKWDGGEGNRRIYFNCGDASGINVLIEDESKPLRIALRYDATNKTFTGFVNGEQSPQGGRATNYQPLFSDTIKFYKDCNSQIKNFRIAHYALSDKQIAALGSPQGE